MIKNDQKLKYGISTYSGPYQMSKVNNNGTVCIKFGKKPAPTTYATLCHIEKKVIPTYGKLQFSPEHGAVRNTYTLMYISRILCPMSSKCKSETAGNITSTSSSNKVIKVAINPDLPSQ
eukprot:15238561-Ditylum_brightwellii.AAC.1